MTLGLGDHRPQRHAGRQPLGRADDVGLDPPVLDGEHLAGAPDARLHFVGDVQDAVPLGQRLQLAMVLRRRDDVAPFPLNRLDDDGRDFFRRERRLEELLFEVRHAFQLARGIRQVVRAAIAVAVADVRHFGDQRLEAAALRDFAGGERQGPHRAAVEGAVEGDDVLPAGVVAGQLDRRLDRLGPRIREQDALGGLSRGDLASFFARSRSGG